jgi:hypothetical protein
VAATRKTGGYALAGGLLGAGVALGVLVATYAARIESLAQAEAERAAGDFLGRTYGLTPERIAKLQAYGTILG